MNTLDDEETLRILEDVTAMVKEIREYLAALELRLDVLESKQSQKH